MDKKKLDFTYLAILIALGNLAMFGALFAAMGYFELIGADTTYFDERSYATIDMIKQIASVFGVDKVFEMIGISLDPRDTVKISTNAYSVAYGLALCNTGLAIMFANRRSQEVYEVTDAKV